MSVNNISPYLVQLIQGERFVFAGVYEFISRVFLVGNFQKKLSMISKPLSFQIYFLFLYKPNNA